MPLTNYQKPACICAIHEQRVLCLSSHLTQTLCTVVVRITSNNFSPAGVVRANLSTNLSVSVIHSIGDDGCSALSDINELSVILFLLPHKLVGSLMRLQAFIALITSSYPAGRTCSTG